MAVPGLPRPQDGQKIPSAGMFSRGFLHLISLPSPEWSPCLALSPREATSFLG